MLLSKALEIVGRHFGESRISRNQGVQSFIDSYFQNGKVTKGSDWLFEMSNERFETRHGIDRGASSVALATSMTSNERVEFASNAGRIVRGFLCHQLGVQMIFSPHN